MIQSPTTALSWGLYSAPVSVIKLDLKILASCSLQRSCNTFCAVWFVACVTFSTVSTVSVALLPLTKPCGQNSVSWACQVIVISRINPQREKMNWSISIHTAPFQKVKDTAVRTGKLWKRNKAGLSPSRASKTAEKKPGVMMSGTRQSRILISFISSGFQALSSTGLGKAWCNLVQVIWLNPFHGLPPFKGKLSKNAG